MACCTLIRVRSLTCDGLLMQRETVAIDTPAISATSLIDAWATKLFSCDCLVLLLSHYYRI